MSLREWMNNNSTVATIAAIVLLVVALGVVALQMRGASAPQYDAYFWDTQTGEPFGAASQQQPPITAPSGGEGVRAHLFSCGACTADEWFGYLETYSEEYQKRREQGFQGMPSPQLQAFTAQHHLIRPLDGEEWMQFDSPQGERLQQETHTRCDSPADLTPCTPGTK